MTTGVDALLRLLQRLATAPSEEAADFTELDHGLQCAFELAARRPGDVELHVAGLVHDIGHLVSDDAGHGRAGAEQVRPVLGARVADLVESHVTAKRYLAATDSTYRSHLSDVSRTTLGLQGGALTPAECAAFEGSPLLGDALELRRSDDAAKVPGRDVPGLDHWEGAIRAVAGMSGR